MNEINNELEETEIVKNVKLNGLGWVYERMASMTVDLHKDMARAGSSYNAVPLKSSQFH